MKNDAAGLYGGVFRIKRKLLVLRIELIILGLLVMFVGIYPVLHARGALPEFLAFLPMEGGGYRVIISLLGILALVAGFRSIRE